MYHECIPMFIKKYLEQLTWSAALLFLFFSDVSNAEYSFCFFKFIGFKSCFGCGIGHAIHYTLHGDFIRAWHEHIMGIPATFFISWQILKPFINKKLNYYGPATAYDAQRHSTR